MKIATCAGQLFVTLALILTATGCALLSEWSNLEATTIGPLLCLRLRK